MTSLLSDHKPILIAGPTASGKSAIALEIAKKTNGAIINADALQVYQGWQILTARPSHDDLEQCPHFMYGHVAMKQPYSVGSWLRDIKKHLELCNNQGLRPIIVGGTGLYLSSLTNGLADIPEIPNEVRIEANQMAKEFGKDVFAKQLEQDDPNTYANIDVLNPKRTQRAWEVLKTTGRGLFDWQKNQQKPLINEVDAHLISVVSDKEWLNTRISNRFDTMIELGALDECRNAMECWWDEALPSCKAIGAKELISHLNCNLELTDAIETAKIKTRRYAKRQRTWFRNRMQMWQKLDISDSNLDITCVF